MEIDSVQRQSVEPDKRSRGQVRQWTDEEMFELIDKINHGYTYQDVTRGKHVPISTLWTRVKGMFQGQIRPKTGSPCMFGTDMEGDIALYMKHCSFLRIPRTKQKLREDILHFVQYKGLNVPRMPEDGPGRSFLDRFANDWKDLVKFHNKSEIFKIENDPISMREWIHERDYYTRIQLMTKYFTSRRYIFVMEVDTLVIEASNRQEFQVVMTYNAQGDLLIPFIPHKQGLQDVLTKHFSGKINFFPTEHGNLDRNCLCILMLIVNLFLIDNKLPESPIIYLAPDLSKHVSLFMWDLTNRHQFVLQTIPHNIYRYFMTCNMGIFEKLKAKFNNLAKQRFPDKIEVCLKFHFFDTLRTVLESSKFSSHLRNSCRRLRIVHVSPQLPQVEDEQEDY